MCVNHTSGADPGFPVGGAHFVPTRDVARFESIVCHLSLHLHMWTHAHKRMGMKAHLYAPCTAQLLRIFSFPLHKD